MTSFEDSVKRSLEHPEEFWSEVANYIHWDKKWDKVMDDSNSPFTQWFVGGKLNMCYNCLDRHVENGFGQKVALIYDSPVTNVIRKYTYDEVLEHVSKLAGILVSFGVKKGDIVAINMPSIPEGVFAFLACTRIGAVHNSIPGGLPAEDLTLRLDHSQPDVLLTTSHGYHNNGWTSYQIEIKKALSFCKHKLSKVLWFQRAEMEPVDIVEDLDFIWQDAIKDATPHPCVSVDSTSPLFVLYTSGSTGTPKAIVHAIGSFAVRLAHDIKMIWLQNKDDIFYGTTSLGWIAGHTIVVYAPFFNQSPSVVYEGDPLLMTDSREMYRLLSVHKITNALIRPGIMRAMKGLDPQAIVSKDFDLSILKIIATGGEYIDSATLEWVYKSFKAPIMNAWGQTEIGGMLIGHADISCYNEKHFYSMSGKIFPGWNIQCLREDMTPTEPGEIGRLLIKLPLPPGGFSTLFKNDELCKTTYFDPYPGYFDTKDEGYVTDTGEIKMERRADDVIKAGPIYVSATAIESVILEHPAVSEATVIAQPHNIHREIPIAFVTLSSGNTDKEEFCKEMVAKVRNYFGKSMPFDSVVIVSELPRTRTGKTHRPSLALLLKRMDPNSGAVENPDVLPEILKALKIAGVV